MPRVNYRIISIAQMIHQSVSTGWRLQAAWAKFLWWIHCSGPLLRLQAFCFSLDLGLICGVPLPSASLPSSRRVMLLLEFLPSHTFQFLPPHIPSDPLEPRQLLSLLSAEKLSGPPASNHLSPPCHIHCLLPRPIVTSTISHHKERLVYNIGLCWGNGK